MNYLFLFFASSLIVNNNNGIVWVFLDGVEPHQGRALWTHPQGVNQGYTTLPSKTMYLEELLMGLNLRCLGLQLIPSLQPDGWYILWVLIWLKYRVGGQIGEILFLVDLGFNVVEETEEFFYKFFYFQPQWKGEGEIQTSNLRMRHGPQSIL